MSTGEDGVFTLRDTAPASVGVLVEQAIREARDALFAAGQSQATLADALVEIANRSLSGLEGTSRSRRYRINVHLDTDGGWLPGVGRLPDHMLRAVTCDGELVPVWETSGQPLNLGRSMRIVPERLRRLVIARDGGCSYPGCIATDTSTSTTSCTGPMAAAPTSTTSSPCARTTTTPITQVSSASSPTLIGRGGSSSPAVAAGCSSPCRPPRPSLIRTAA